MDNKISLFKFKVNKHTFISGKSMNQFLFSCLYDSMSRANVVSWSKYFPLQVNPILCNTFSSVFSSAVFEENIEVLS